MSRVTCDLGISVDGYVAGPSQRLEEPLGDGGERLFTGVGDPGLRPVAVSGTDMVTHITYRIGR